MGCCSSSDETGLKACMSKVSLDLGVNVSQLECISQWNGVGQDIYIIHIKKKPISKSTFKYERMGDVYKKVDFDPPYVEMENKEEGQVSDHPVISRVAFDFGLNQSKIRMIRETENGNNEGEYILKVDGKYVKYIKIGSMYLPENYNDQPEATNTITHVQLK
eukprot:295931_1